MRNFSPIPYFLYFYYEECWILSDALSALIEMTVCFFPFNINVVYCYFFFSVELPYIPCSFLLICLYGVFFSILLLLTYLYHYIWSKFLVNSIVGLYFSVLSDNPCLLISVFRPFNLNIGFPGGSESTCQCKRHGLQSNPGLGRFSGKRNGNPLQFSCFGHPMDGGAW